MNDTPIPAPYLPTTVAKGASVLDEATRDMIDALDSLQRRVDSLVGQLKPVTRLPTPQAPAVGQPMPPKPADLSSPVVTAINGWKRTVNALSDKIVDLEKSLDI